MSVYLYIHNKYTEYTHIYYVNKNLFWMRLITINHLTALIYIYSFFFFVIIIVVVVFIINNIIIKL